MAEKKGEAVNFRLTGSFREAVKQLTELHGVENLSQYFRGLVYLDATLAGENTDLIDKPAWVTRSYGQLLRNVVAAMKSGTASVTDHVVDGKLQPGVVRSSHSPLHSGDVTKEEQEVERRLEMGKDIIRETQQGTEPRKKSRRSKAS